MLLSRNPQQQQLCYLLDETLGLWWQEQMPGLCLGLALSISLAAAGRSAGMPNVNTVKSHNLIWLFALCHHHCATICHPPSPGLVTLDISSVNVINAINTVINIIIPPAALTSVAVGLIQVWLRYLCAKQTYIVKLRQGSGKERQGMVKGERWKALKPKPLPRAYIKIGCHLPTTIYPPPQPNI